MHKYPNLSGNSCITDYQIGDNYIIVFLNKGSAYAYTYSTAGVTHVETMKSHALLGRGLCTYIKENLKPKHARKLR